MFAALLSAMILCGGQPKVVIVLADDVGFEDMFTMNIPPANLNAMAAAGMVFTSAYAMPVCGATRTSLTYGRFSILNGGQKCLPPDSDTTPLSVISIANAVEPFEASMIGKWGIGTRPDTGDYLTAPQGRGFEIFRGLPNNVEQSGTCLMGDGYNNWEHIFDGASALDTSYAPIVQQSEAMERVLNQDGGLVFYSSSLAHSPYHRPPNSLLPPGYPPSFGTRQRFEAMITALDGFVGEIMASLDFSKDYLVFVGDNGTPGNLSTTPGKAKLTTFENGIHVPLAIVGPGIAPRTVNQNLVHVADLLPTVCDMLGVSQPSEPAIDGLSVLGTAKHRYIMCGSTGIQDPPVFDVCAKSKRFKLRRFGTDLNALTEEFYDLLLDPGETHNAIAMPVYWNVISSLRAFLDSQLVP